MNVFDKDRRARMVKEVRQKFHSAGWTLHLPENGTCDFQAANRTLRYVVECIDGSVASFMPPSRIFETVLKSDKGDLRAKYLSHVVIFEEDFREFDFQHHVRHGTAMLLLEDLAQVTAIPRFYEALPNAILPIEQLLIQQCVDLSLSISTRFETQDIGEAITWATRAMNTAPNSQYPYRTLIALHERAGEHQEAEEIALKALKYYPKDTSFRKVAHRAAVKRGDDYAIKRWAPLPSIASTAEASSTERLFKPGARPIAPIASDAAKMLAAPAPFMKKLKSLWSKS